MKFDSFSKYFDSDTYLYQRSFLEFHWMVDHIISAGESLKIYLISTLSLKSSSGVSTYLFLETKSCKSDYCCACLYSKFFLHEDIPIPNSKEGFSIHDLEALSLTIFRWCATRRSPGAGSVEGGAVVGRRLTTLPTKATHELAKKASL